MAIQMTFKRFETKYLLTAEQKEKILQAMQPYMALDQYGRSSIRNLYYDTEDFRLVRHSIDKPAYKEKVRVRSYGPAGEEDKVFVELKKKYDDIVYKRRLTLPGKNAEDWLAGRSLPQKNNQIAKEIGYARDYYGTLEPRVFLSYEREAYYDRQGGDFRITFDENILARTDRLSLAEEPDGERLIPEGRTLMEVKCSGGYPLWLVRILSSEHIYKTSFSKYGTAYTMMILRHGRRMPAAAAVRIPDRQKVQGKQWIGGRKYA